MDDLTVIIHSYSSSDIVKCIKSAQLLTKQIIIIGEEKRIQVKKKLDTLNLKIIPLPNPGIVELARVFGISKSQTDWVFLLDADERMTSKLAEEIEHAIKSNEYSHYQVSRKEILFHQYWLKYGGWWPNYQTRLINKKYFVDWPKHIHSTPVIKGKKGFLSEPFLHYSQNDFSDIINRTIIFESNESELLFKAKRHVSTFTFFRKFFGELFRRLIYWQGFRDGTIGIIESIYQAFSKTITYIFLYEKSRSI